MKLGRVSSGPVDISGGVIPWQHCPHRLLEGGLAELVRSTAAAHSQPTASRSLCPGRKELYKVKSIYECNGTHTANRKLAPAYHTEYRAWSRFVRQSHRPRIKADESKRGGNETLWSREQASRTGT